MARPSSTGGKASKAKASNASPAKGRKTTKTKRRIAPAATRVKRRPVSDPSKDLKEAREQQAATAEILKVIASSPSDAQPVFEAIAASANRLIGGFSAGVFRLVDGIVHLASYTPVNPAADEALKASFPRSVAELPYFDLAKNGEVSQEADTENSPDDRLKNLARARGFRSRLLAPLMSNKTQIGVIAVTRKNPGPFAAHQVELLQTFADQAVIAIENVRLFKEVQAKTRDLSEALTYQTGSGSILSVIASSPTDIEPVLKAIVERTCELCEAYDAVIRLKIGDEMVHVAHHGTVPKTVNAFPLSPNWTAGRSLLEKKAVHVHDMLSAEGDEFPAAQELARHHGHRTVLSVPLLRENEGIGAITLRRLEVDPFSDKQIKLLQTFADQAVIAIGNVRMFEEVQAKTRDLTESLQQQTATADVLKVISRSAFDLQPVFDTIVQTARRLCDAEYATIYELRDDDKYHVVANNGADPVFLKYAVEHPMAPERGFLVGRTALERKTVHMPDCLADTEYSALEYQSMGHYRSMLGVPLLREGVSIGVIALMRTAVLPFTEKQIELVTTFADQAVIAIENARLFNETKEALERQTATADVLKAISSSFNDLKPVFETIGQRAEKLCNAEISAISVLNDDQIHMASIHGTTEEGVEAIRRAYPMGRDGETLTARAIRHATVCHVPDVLSDPLYPAKDAARAAKYRAALAVPMIREGEVIGAIFVARQQPGVFTDAQVQLLKTFADQAVIAIENARLFEELRDRQAELRVTFDNMGDGVVMFDAAGRLTAWNRNFQELIELPESFLAGRPTRAEYFRYLADRGEFVSADLEAQLGRTVDDTGLEMRYERTRPDGRIIEVRRNPVPGGGFVLIYSDITRRKRAEEAIRAARDAAESTLRELQTAQASLVHAQKMAALGQLTAGIAHEIKNPLNFVNNFAALSSELTDELSDVLKPVALPDKVREEVKELTGTLKDNLGRVVQHGKRADSIVKNMLLHSREGSGERQSVGINSLVEESLNLAYHGARAEKAGFSITLKHDFDPDAGALDLYPQEMTRALLNLISNGFYAATRRKAEAGDDTFEPVLSAVTRNLDKTVEIRIRDNGTGILPEVREKMFNPFFTTKPTGEGTGLGLSMTHDIIVKQHGGRIEVETEFGAFTEFIITLPRDNGTAARPEAGMTA